MKKTFCATTLVSCLTATSCVGPNNAFNGLSSWNSRVTESKWGNELIYLGMWIIPVYEIALLCDGLVFNSIEFWGGKNPIDAPAAFSPQNKKE